MAYQYKNIVEPLLEWYDKNKRILPWRDVNSPYYTWISEIMLQQTRVEAAKEYFYRFIDRLPSIEDLAAIEEEQLTKLWEGLGYYNRARNLQKAAKIICDSYDKVIPKEVNDLLNLPGIGPYTAGAIASIAYQQRVPAVDGNVVRIAMRLEASNEDIANPKVSKRITEELKQIIPKRAGDFNQALMDLGAVICIPNGSPKCECCPLTDQCNAYLLGKTSELPVKSKKSKRKIEEKTILVIAYKGKYLIHKRPNKGLLAGLWEIPNVDTLLELSEIQELCSVQATEVENLGNAKHIFSHVEWIMIGYLINLSSLESLTDEFVNDSVWADPNELNQIYSIPSAFDAYKKWK